MVALTTVDLLLLDDFVLELDDFVLELEDFVLEAMNKEERRDVRQRLESPRARREPAAGRAHLHVGNLDPDRRRVTLQVSSRKSCSFGSR
ncbi:hypothetical protein WME97_18590 [Sorangium sp. So ce367]|uniref:hypothetical protein n=1 Tax=Sorangium sp. So ce367 TaxID=3133305 RepID=UPI003F631E2F